MTNSKLDQALRGLDREKLPERDLWIGIEHSISAAPTQDKKLSMPIYATAASIIVLVAVAMFSFESGQETQNQVIAQQLSDDYLQQRERLLATFDGAAVTATNFERQLADLDQAAEAIKKAIAEEPSNPVLLKMLKRIYAQQIALIEKAHAPQWQQI